MRSSGKDSSGDRHNAPRYFLIISYILLPLLLSSSSITGEFPFITESGPTLIDNPPLAEKERLMRNASTLLGSYFIENKGQIPVEDCLFYSPSGDILLLNDGFILRFREVVNADDFPIPQRPYIPANEMVGVGEIRERGVVLRYTFLEANDPTVEGKKRCSWDTNYFIGKDPNRWYTDVPNYREVVYHNVWDGVDVIFRLSNGFLKYDIIISPGADPEEIKIRIDGCNDLKIDFNGNMIIKTELWDIIEGELKAFYSGFSNLKINVKFTIYDPHTFGFALGNHDKSRAIVVDPLVYSTFLGGLNLDASEDLIVDSYGNVYVAGWTDSRDYPTTSGAYSRTYRGVCDIFVTKLNPSGASLIYSTYIGGSGSDYANTIVLDSMGNAFISGYTRSSNYPVLQNAYDATFNGSLYSSDAFITVLSPTGSSLVYSTYLGGNSSDWGEDLAISPQGWVYVIGGTWSEDFPTTNNAWDTTHNGYIDAFLSIININTSSLIYSSFIGGSQWERGTSITLDSSGEIYVCGCTNSSDYPTTAGVYDGTYNGDYDVFITVFNTSSPSLVSSTFLGGEYGEGGLAGKITILEGPSGKIYIGGNTNSVNYPTTSGAFDDSFNGGFDVFVTVLDHYLSSVLYSSFLGGASNESAIIGVDISENIYVAGSTESPDYPTTTNAYDASYNGFEDVFLTILNIENSTLLYSTFIGGSSSDGTSSIFVRPSHTTYILYLGGSTKSRNYPTTSEAYCTSNNGFIDAFVTKILIEFSPPRFILDSTPHVGTTGDPLTFRINITDNVVVKSAFVEFWYDNSTHYNLTMHPSNNSTWYCTITVNNTLNTLHYIFHAVDTSKNWNHTPVKNITIIDNDPPIFLDDLTPDRTIAGQNLTFSVIVSDNIGVKEVYLEFWYEPGNRTNISMRETTDNTWSYSITTLNTTDPIHYTFYAVDTSNNWNNTQRREVNLLDITPPTFIRDRTPPTATTGDPLTFTVNITDNIGIRSATVEYWYNDQDHKNETMRRSDGITWTHTIRVANTLGKLYYIIHASDSSNNWLTGEIKEITILDNDPPTFNTEKLPEFVTTGDPFYISIIVKDNIAVNSVYMEYWYGDEPRSNITMVEGENNVWIAELIVKETTQRLHLTFHAQDSSNNWNSTGTVEIEVRDSDKPIIGSDATPRRAYTGDNFTISVEIKDNVGVMSAWVMIYWLGGNNNITLSKINDTWWSATITIPPSTTDPFSYVVVAMDYYGNVVMGYERRVEVEDNDPPHISLIEEGGEATTGDPFTLRVEVQDNIEVREVFVEYWYGEGEHVNGSMTHISGDLWEEIIRVENTTEILYYVIHSVDSSGNWVCSSPRTITVHDNDPPLITIIKRIPSVVRGGDEISLKVEAQDNVCVKRVWVEYWYDDGPHKNTTLEESGSYYSTKIRTPKGDGKHLHIIIYAEDTGGNVVSSSEYDLEVRGSILVYIGIAGLLIVSSLLVFILFRKVMIKRKSHEEE